MRQRPSAVEILAMSFRDPSKPQVFGAAKGKSGCRHGAKTVGSAQAELPHFRYLKTSPEIIRLAVMMYVRYPLSLRNVEDLLHERGIAITHETVRFWWSRFGVIFATEIRRSRV
uniref:hypothetical protein n=1 Tax=Phreatobacter aquaticus TaxID=2570229 RepID=UPI001C074B6B|nr:hypothetical protein [Phreatobacter aquaticus]